MPELHRFKIKTKVSLWFSKSESLTSKEVKYLEVANEFVRVVAFNNKRYESTTPPGYIWYWLFLGRLERLGPMKKYKIISPILLDFHDGRMQHTSLFTPISAEFLECDGATIWVVMKNGTRQETINLPSCMEFYLHDKIIEEVPTQAMADAS